MRTALTLAPLPDFSRSLSDIMFPFPCPRCGHEFRQALGWFESNNQIACPDCKETIVCDPEQFREALRQLRVSLAHLWQSVGYVL
jgi:DNA-directed RNA polymerase subunit RPC12/RpoP